MSNVSYTNPYANITTTSAWPFNLNGTNFSTYPGGYQLEFKQLSPVYSSLKFEVDNTNSTFTSSGTESGVLTKTGTVGNDYSLTVDLTQFSDGQIITDIKPAVTQGIQGSTFMDKTYRF